MTRHGAWVDGQRVIYVRAERLARDIMRVVRGGEPHARTTPTMRICSLAHAVPARLVTNDELVLRLADRQRHSVAAAELDAMCAFLRDQLELTGARTRYHRAEQQKSLELGLVAARRALAAAGIGPESIDLLIYTGVGRGFVEPATANVFQTEIGLSNSTCFDILDACASWLRGVDVAHHLLAAGSYRRAMILNCEGNFSEYEPADIASREQMKQLWSGFTVGEAATATILAADHGDTEYRASFKNAGAHVDDCQIPLPHAAQFRNGHGPVDLAPMMFHARPGALASGAIKQLHRQYWSDPVMPTLGYDIVFGHSVSVPVSRIVLRQLKLDPARYYEIFPTYGNVVSASLPLAMSLAQDEGRLQRGHRVLLVMGGAGLTTALSTFMF